MARIKGLFSVSSNYEPTIAAPLDAREVVQFKSDLYARKTWLKNDSIFLYNGLRVSVTEDTEQNNGVYVLIDKDSYMETTAWKKLATTAELDELRAEIEGGGGSDFDPSEIVAQVEELKTQVEQIPVVKSGEEVMLDENNTLKLAKASVEKLFIPEGSVLILNGGETVE